MSAAAVGAYIGAAYWFTSSTSFANPAVTIGRMFSDSFAGIAPGSAPSFIAAQIVGTLIGLALIVVLYPGIAVSADDVVVPHEHSARHIDVDQELAVTDSPVATIRILSRRSIRRHQTAVRRSRRRQRAVRCRAARRRPRPDEIHGARDGFFAALAVTVSAPLSARAIAVTAVSVRTSTLLRCSSACTRLPSSLIHGRPHFRQASIWVTAHYAGDKNLGHLQADVAGADDGRCLRVSRGEGFHDDEGVAHGVQQVHAVRRSQRVGASQADDWWPGADGAGTHDEGGVGQLLRDACASRMSRVCSLTLIRVARVSVRTCIPVAARSAAVRWAMLSSG